MIEDCIELAPLHNPANLRGIRAAQELFGEGVPAVAVFDTAFHSTMPETSYLYGLPYQEVDARSGSPTRSGEGERSPHASDGALAEALAGALDAPGSHVLVVRTDREENERMHRELRREIRDTLTSITTEGGDDER